MDQVMFKASTKKAMERHTENFVSPTMFDQMLHEFWVNLTMMSHDRTSLKMVVRGGEYPDELAKES